VTPGSNPGAPTNNGQIMSDIKVKLRAEKAQIVLENKRLGDAMRPHGKNFSKKKEDFVCGKCGTAVKGNGYTNHCPNCLYSKHVDVKPGDRLAECGGLMKPIRVEGTEKAYRVLQRCIVCGYEKINKVASEDSIETLVAIIKENSSRFAGK
jgi:Zn finger protein HypA/HybF involved in hydrogenase expression